MTLAILGDNRKEETPTQIFITSNSYTYFINIYFTNGCVICKYMYCHFVCTLFWLELLLISYIQVILSLMYDISCLKVIRGIHYIAHII